MAKQTHTTTAPTEAAPSRRSLLSFLVGTAAVATGAAAMPATAEAATVIEEVPELLEMGRELSALTAAYWAASSARAKAADEYHRLAPALPDELIEKRRTSSQALSVEERDIDGETFYAEEDLSARRKARTRAVTNNILLVQNQEKGDLAGRHQRGNCAPAQVSRHGGWRADYGKVPDDRRHQEEQADERSSRDYDRMHQHPERAPKGYRQASKNQRRVHLSTRYHKLGIGNGRRSSDLQD